MSGWAGLAGLLLAVAGAQKQLLAPPSSLRPAAAEHAAQFDHVFNGTVNRGAERLYSFNYTSKAGQVRRQVLSGAGAAGALEGGATRGRGRAGEGRLAGSGGEAGGDLRWGGKC